MPGEYKTVQARILTYAPAKPEARRGLVWHTQGSGKTFTMIKAAELLFKAAGADKPTVLVLIDRNELDDQMLRNLAMLVGIEVCPEWCFPESEVTLPTRSSRPQWTKSCLARASE